jgi:hypothetical protein
MALALGKEDPDPARSFSGNRPSSTIVLPDLSPESIGRLLSFYESKTVYEAFLWGINPFDQPDVEAAKIKAREIVTEYTATGTLPDGDVTPADPVVLRSRRLHLPFTEPPYAKALNPGTLRIMLPKNHRNRRSTTPCAWTN